MTTTTTTTQEEREMRKKCDCGGLPNGECLHAWCGEAPEAVNLVAKAWLRGFEMNSPRPDDRPVFVWLDREEHPFAEMITRLASAKYDQADEAYGYSASVERYENGEIDEEPEEPQELSDIWESVNAYSDALRWEISANISGYSTLEIFYFPNHAAPTHTGWYCRDGNPHTDPECGPMVAIDFQTALFLAENAFFVNREQ